MTNTNKKLVLVGDGGTGKSSFVKFVTSGQFDCRYIATLGSELTPWTCGPIHFTIWDTAGQEKFGGLRDGYYIEADAVLIFFSQTSKLSYKNIKNWYSNVRKVCGPNKPVIICGNKLDAVKEEEIMEAKIPDTTAYFAISSKTGKNVDNLINCLVDHLI
jgi:GTP-binding nuclear protein Ran